ncbi:MAG: hypothetical protein AAF614_23670 [Chloroflexota bacterium]
MNNTKWTFCLRLLKISSLFGLIGLFLLSIQPSFAQDGLIASEAEAVAPPTGLPSSYNWNIEDCSGRAINDNYDGSNPVVEDDSNGPNGLPCQSYGLDLYEDLEYGAVDSSTEENAECADIEWFRVTSDATWAYIEFDQVAHDAVCSSHQIAIEFDVDADTESLRSDYLIYGGSSSCNEGAWTDAKDASWEGYRDANNDAGGANPGTGATCSLPINKDGNDPLTSSHLGSNKFYKDGEDGCSDKYDGTSDGDNGDGFETDHKLDGGDEVYCRWDGDKLHVAIRRTYLGLSNPDNGVRVRGHSDQQSSFDKAKMYAHDLNDADFLGSSRRDNVDWHTGSNATSISLSDLQVTTPVNLTILTTFLLFTILSIGSVLALRQRD